MTGLGICICSALKVLKIIVGPLNLAVQTWVKLLLLSICSLKGNDVEQEQNEVIQNSKNWWKLGMGLLPFLCWCMERKFYYRFERFSGKEILAVVFKKQRRIFDFIMLCPFHSLSLYNLKVVRNDFRAPLKKKLIKDISEHHMEPILLLPICNFTI